MATEFSRTQMLLGQTAMANLESARVAVFGIGGVGSFTAQALARSGIGHIDLIDNDTVSLSNINRQLVAFHSTVGQYKTDVMANMIHDINPAAQVGSIKVFYSQETADLFDFSAYDYIVDAVDTVAAKLLLAVNAQKAGTPIISCMGAGNKLDPTAFEVTDIYKTSVCPLARVMRYELKKRGVKKLKVVYSKEVPLSPSAPDEGDGAAGKRQTPGSTAFVPSVAGLILAGEVVKDLGFKDPIPSESS